MKDDYPLAGSAYDDDEDDEDDEWAGDDTTWADEVEVEDEADGKDESSAYLEFLNEEVRERASKLPHANMSQAQKFGNIDNDAEDELAEESLLETPLDKVEPYQLFRDALLSKCNHFRRKGNPIKLSGLMVIPELQREQPQLYDTLTSNLTPDEKTIVQSVVHQAEVLASRGVGDGSGIETNGGAS